MFARAATKRQLCPLIGMATPARASPKSWRNTPLENTMQPTTPRIAVIGCGYWGKNHVRTMQALGALAAVCDLTEVGRRLAAETAPNVPVFKNLDELFA